MKDFLDEQIEKRTARNPAFPALLAAAHERRQIARALVAARQQAGKTQVDVAEEIGTSQSQVARIESGNGDVKLSTLIRYGAAIGCQIELQLQKLPKPRRRRAVAAAAPR